MTGEGSRADVSVLFFDIRNSTVFIDNFDGERVSRILDTLFRKSQKCIEANNGEIDKILGDCLLAVFDGAKPSESAVTAAVAIHQEAVPETEATEELGSIDIGIGIATGEVFRTNLADIESTVLGRPVNLAARLEGLCKKYGLSILIDQITYREIQQDSLPDSYNVRKIPNQSLQGINKNEIVYNLCDNNRLSKYYTETFNRGLSKFLNQNYESALSEFTEAYTRHERYNDQVLLNEFTNKCLAKLRNKRDLFWDPDRFEKHSNTVVQQSYTLQEIVSEEIGALGFQPKNVLDVGCLTGNVTEKVLKNRLLPNAHITAIDHSMENINKARAKHQGDDPHIEYVKASIDRYAPEDDYNTYDLIFSNSTLHLIENQIEAYTTIHKLLSTDGVLAVHQGANGTYQELHEVVLELINRYNWEHYFDPLDIPLGFTYHTEDEMKALLSRCGFEISQFKILEESALETIIEDFTEASLIRYLERLENNAQREVFRDQFKLLANQELDPDDITVRRIYFTAFIP